MKQLVGMSSSLKYRLVQFSLPLSHALILLFVFLFVVHSLIAFNWSYDDTFISHRYAKNFAEGWGLVFNKTGQPVQGYSNFLWVVILAAGYRLGLNVYVAEKVINIVFSSGTVIVASLLAKVLAQSYFHSSVRRLGHILPAVAIAIVGGGLALSWFLTVWTVGGMETSFYTFLVTSGVASVVWELWASRMPIISAILFLLASITRPEGILFLFMAVFIFGAFVLWPKIQKLKWRGIDSLLTYAAPFQPSKFTVCQGFLLALACIALVYVPYMGWKWWYYGDPFPATYYAKTSSSQLQTLMVGLRYILNFLTDKGLFAVLLGISSAIVVIQPPSSALAAYTRIVVITSVGLYAVLFLLGSAPRGWEIGYRFIVPIYPLLLLLVVQAMLESFRIMRRLHGGGMISSVIYLSIYLSIVWSSSAVFEYEGTSSGGPRDFPYSVGRFVGLQPQSLRSSPMYSPATEALISHLNCNYPQEYTIALTEAGYIPSSIHLRVLDMVGLNDISIAKLVKSYGHASSQVVTHILNQKPELIIIQVYTRDGTLPTSYMRFETRLPLEMEIVQSERFQHDYSLRQVFFPVIDPYRVTYRVDGTHLAYALFERNGLVTGSGSVAQCGSNGK